MVITTKGNGWSSNHTRLVPLVMPAAMISTVSESLVGTSPLRLGGFQCRSDLRGSKKEGDGEGVGDSDSF